MEKNSSIEVILKSPESRFLKEGKMDFCLSIYVSELQKMCFENISQEDLLNLLIKYFVETFNLSLKNKEIYYLDKKQVSKIMTRVANAPSKIRSCFGKRNYNENDFCDFFHKRIFGKLNSNLVEVKCKEFYEILNTSDLTSLSVKQKLTNAIRDNNFSNFLSIALILALSSFPNKLQQKSDEELAKEIKHKLTTHSQKEEIPTEIQENENPYLTAIVDAISEKDNKSYSLSELKDNKKYNERIERHRSEFYSAEFVRRQSREIFDENEDPFDELQDELMNGIFYTVEKKYDDGYERLTSSLEQAAQVSIESNPLIKETNIVSIKAKQGLCHTLINDNKLDGWTNDKYF